MINKYNNPRLFNTVLTGPGMTHPRNPHVVIGSDNKGFVQGDLMDANAIMETIDQKIDVDNLIDEEKLTTTVQTAVDSILGDVSESLDTLKEVEDKFKEVEGKIPTKLSQLENEPFYTTTPPKLGECLFDDFTWGPYSARGGRTLLGTCVGTADMFEDGKARFAKYDPSIKLVWSTEEVDTPLNNVSNLESDTIDGLYNTTVLKNMGSDKYPAASYATTMFDGKGYIPTGKEVSICEQYITKYISTTISVFHTSTEIDYKNRAYANGNRYGVTVDYSTVGNTTKKSNSEHVLVFFSVEVPKATYITTTDLATTEKAGLMSSEQYNVVSKFSDDGEDISLDQRRLYLYGGLAVDNSVHFTDGVEFEDDISCTNIYASGDIEGKQVTLFNPEDATDKVTFTIEDFKKLKQLISNG